MSVVANTKKSEEFFERAKRVAPGGVHSPVRGFRGVGGTPRFIDSAQGAEMIDVDGNRYVDFCMSWGPLIFGHQDADVAEAVRSALTRGWSYGAAETRSLELAELLTSSLPFLQKVRFVNSGTEAVMAALRVARAVTSRSKILKFEGCYHGHVDSMLVKAGSGLAEMASPDSAGVSEQVAGETLVAPLNQLEAVRKIFAERGNEIAAVIIEPLPANNGLLTQTTEYLRELTKIARAHGALMIFDEVISGFRVALGGMAERTGIEPDLVTYGKIIGGGFPVGAYGGRAELMDWVAPAGPVYQAGTLSANPIAMSAGLATVKKLKTLSPYAELESRTRELAARLSGAAHGTKWEGRVRIQQESSLFWTVFGDVKTSDGVVRSPEQIPAEQKAEFARMFHSLLSHSSRGGKGYYLAPSGYEVGFLSTAHTLEHLEGLVGAVREYFAASSEV